MNSQGTGVRTIDIVKQGLAKRYRAERRFRFYGLSAILVSIVVLALLFISIIGNGYTAFWQTRIRLDVTFDPEVLQRDTLANADYDALVRAALQKLFPEVQGRQERRQLNGMISSGAAYVVAVDDDIDVVFLEHPHVHFDRHRRGDAEEDVGDLGGDHGPAPAVGQRRAVELLGDVDVVLVDPHVGAVHHLHDLAHGPAWDDALLAPGFKCLGRHTAHEGNLPLHLGVGALELGVEVLGDVHHLAAFGLDPDGLGDRIELFRVLDAVVLDVAVDHLAEEIEHAHAVVGVGGAAGGDEAGEVAGLDRIDGGPADPDLGVRVAGVQAAGTHEAVLAAGRLGADRAGLHAHGALEGGFDPVFAGFDQHLGRRIAGGQFTGFGHLLVLFLGDEFFFVFHLKGLPSWRD